MWNSIWLNLFSIYNTHWHTFSYDRLWKNEKQLSSEYKILHYNVYAKQKDGQIQMLAQGMTKLEQVYFLTETSCSLKINSQESWF